MVTSSGLSIASKNPIRRTGVQGKQPVKKLVIKNFTGKMGDGEYIRGKKTVRLV